MAEGNAYALAARILGGSPGESNSAINAALGRMRAAISGISAGGVVSFAQGLEFDAGVVMTVDGSRMINVTGADNVFLGQDAGNLTLTGTGGNTAIGRTAGLALTTGYYNNFIGRSCGNGTTTGYQNNFMGAFTGSANTTGTNNTFIGDSAGRLNTTGLSNTMIGRAAGDANTTGNYAAFLGHQAGFRNTTGSFNTYLGDTAAQWATTGGSNVCVGVGAGAPSEANGLTTASFCTFIGAGSGFASSTQRTKATAIGYNALVNADNALILGGTGADAVTVGIGTTTPDADAILDLTSTTKAFLPPRMTSTQRDAIPTPTAGMVIYNATTNKLNVYTTAWEAVTSA